MKWRKIKQGKIKLIDESAPSTFFWGGLLLAINLLFYKIVITSPNVNPGLATHPETFAFVIGAFNLMVGSVLLFIGLIEKNFGYEGYTTFVGTWFTIVGVLMTISTMTFAFWTRRAEITAALAKYAVVIITFTLSMLMAIFTRLYIRRGEK